MEPAPSATAVPKHHLYTHRQGRSPHQTRGSQEGPAEILLPQIPRKPGASAGPALQSRVPPQSHLGARFPVFAHGYKLVSNP